jgi:hypothetical protein
MSDIPGLIIELKEISTEIINKSKEIAKLKYRKKHIEEQLCKFFDEKNQPGVKYKGVAVVAEEATTRTRKKKIEKENDCIGILKKNNVNNPEKIYKEIMDKMKGDEVTKKRVRIQSVKQ